MDAGLHSFIHNEFHYIKMLLSESLAEVYISCIIIASNVCSIQFMCCCVWMMSLSHTVRLKSLVGRGP